MKWPVYPKELSASTWERQAGALAKGRGVTLGADLKGLERQFAGLDPKPLEAEKLASADDVDACLARVEGEWGKAARALCDALRAVETAAGKLADAWRRDPAARAALQATDAALRTAAALRSEIDAAVKAAGPSLARRRDELRAATRKGQGVQSPERRRIATRLKDQLRIVKNRPDVKVVYLVCLGRESGAAWLGPTASDSQRPLLVKALAGDTGFKFYRGECIWEEGSYTFVGPNMSKTLARRIEAAVMELTGTRYRIRARTEE